MTLFSTLSDHQAQIEAWFQTKTQSPLPLYSSIDIRNAGFKIAPVDTNLFPAGFNNLNPLSYPLGIEAFKQCLMQYPIKNRKILLIPESHTRNPFYFENIFVLTQLIHQAGYDIKIGSLLDLTDTQDIELASGKKIILEPLIKTNHTLHLKEFNPDIIILNHDLSEGVPNILQDILQPIIPPLNMGWFNRTKTGHFTIYNQLASELAQVLNVDPWFLISLFYTCDNLSFLDPKNDVIKKTLIPIASTLLNEIEQKYKQYNIEQKPFIVIKADTGTYGMAVMMIESVEQLANLTRKQKFKMSMGKGKQVVSRVIIQEGIPTIEQVNDFSAEPVIYSVGENVVGGFYRFHKEKGPTHNLNSPGMHFEFMKEIPYAYQVIARLTQLAASLENREGKS